MPPKPKKEIKAKVKLQLTAGKATPSPPVGPALGQHGVAIGEFVSQFNERTRDIAGTIVPVEITIYVDRKFDFFVKSPPASILVKQAAGLAKGSTLPGRQEVGTVRREQLVEIAKTKMADLNSFAIDAAVRQIAGTCRSMGIRVVD
jgi:large subunit ribosomal protein L11